MKFFKCPSMRVPPQPKESRMNPKTTMMPWQVKVFSANCPKVLEKKLQDWFLDGVVKNIGNVSQSQSSSFGKTHYTVTYVYQVIPSAPKPA